MAVIRLKQYNRKKWGCGRPQSHRQASVLACYHTGNRRQIPSHPPRSALRNGGDDSGAGSIAEEAGRCMATMDSATEAAYTRNRQNHHPHCPRLDLLC